MNTPSPGTEAPDLYSFLDYREFLRAHYEHRRARQKSFSYRFMAARLDVDAGQLAHILRGRLQLPQRALSATIALCHLDERQGAYFEELVRLAACKDDEERERIVERLDALREISVRQIPSSSAHYYDHWKHATLRALAGILPSTGDGSTLGRHCFPPLSAPETAESVAFLERAGLLGRDEWGRLAPTDAHVAPSPDIPREALRQWHEQVLELASRCLDRIPADQRDVSTLTVALSQADVRTVTGWIAEFRRAVQALATASSHPDRVSQVCVQMIPVSKAIRKRKAA
ncbi:MAG TPA: TIGR02147 family protein [Fibrobacteria bacterium]|nr:TIGR02147 family protein [Fibrobacteria bacterium]HOX50860.1 TIGR02147 family protein [Fibrobacteria bacterium]